jgi:D-sedoheptulose 7-phosphate isomerase
MSATVAVLAGGLATRLWPTTEGIPKSLVEVDGRPFAEHQIELLRGHGLNDIVFLVGHLGEMVVKALGDGSRYDVRLRYAFDGPRPMGTGGAIRRALPELGDRFFVLYGDSYLECDYAGIEHAFAQGGKAGLMTVYRNDDRWDRSNVAFADGRILRYDKQGRTPDMRHLDYGLGMFRADVFRSMGEGGRRKAEDSEAFDLASVYQQLLAEDQLAGYEVATRFYEIGSPAGLEETRAHIAGKRLAMQTSYSERHLAEAAQVIAGIDAAEVEKMVALVVGLRARGGRLFFLGVGGSAANCSHAVNDFRKIAGIEAYTPTDNVSELTARTNDDGWETVFVNWLKGSRLQSKDMLFVMSVGGGSVERNVSPNLVLALRHAKDVGAQVVGIVGRDGGYTAQVADACVIIPAVNPDNVTPHTEAFQAVVWHLLVSHPALKAAQSKWESTAPYGAPSSSTGTGSSTAR